MSNETSSKFKNSTETLGGILDALHMLAQRGAPQMSSVAKSVLAKIGDMEINCEYDETNTCKRCGGEKPAA